MSERPQRNLAMDLVRVTESAALAAARHMGLGEKDEAPMLYNGEMKFSQVDYGA